MINPLILVLIHGKTELLNDSKSWSAVFCRFQNAPLSNLELFLIDTALGIEAFSSTACKYFRTRFNIKLTGRQIYFLQCPIYVLKLSKYPSNELKEE